MFVNPDFYCVYLLQSIVKPKSFYIGSTTDPVRRLKQHNGELKAGGAFRTKRAGFRPWKMVLIVCGLPSKVAALQLEHAFQHPHVTRHINDSARLSKSRGAGNNSIHIKLGNLRLLLASRYFSSLNLKLLIFSLDTWASWQNNKHNIQYAPHLEVHHFNFNSYFQLDPVGEIDGATGVFGDVRIHQAHLFETAKQVLINSPSACIVCNELIDMLPDEITPNLLVGCCVNCSAPFHLACLAKEILEVGDILPKRGPCPTCYTELAWNDMAWLATNLRKYCLSA